MITPADILADLWTQAGLPAAALGRADLTGAEPALPSSFRIGACAQASVAAATLAAAMLDGKRRVQVDMRHAAVAFRSERHLRIAGAPPPDPWDSIAGAYPCADGTVRLHTNFPHHRDGVLRLLGCAPTREAVAAALRAWPAVAFEDAAAEAGLCVTAMRDFAAWDAHPQARAVAAAPLVAITRIGDAPAEVSRGVAGLRVLDLTRVIAGPVCGRTLAAHGADVLAMTAAHLPQIPSLVVDTGRGKRTAFLDLRAPDGRAGLADLLRGADVFVQGYRPGGLAAAGFGPAEAARLRPGIVYVSLSAYGASGPWAARHGFDSLTQTATGLNVAEAEAAGVAAPKVLPAQALDHASGYLLAFGALAALHRRATEGGSWHVQVSLARTGHWLRGLGRLVDGFACPDPGQDDVADLLETTESGFGPITAVRHPAAIDGTPLRFRLPAMPLGSHAPVWA